MADLTVRPPRSTDFPYLADHLRAADRAEVLAACGQVNVLETLVRCAARSSHAWVWAEGETPVAIFGVTPISLLGGVGSPWLLGTDAVFDHPRALMADSRRYLSLVRETYPILYNYVDARNARSIRYLRRLGFTLHEPAPYGALGLPFHKFSIGAA